MTTRRCAECGSDFRAQRSTAKFCSDRCRKRASRGSRDEIKALRRRATELERQQIKERGTVKNAQGQTVRGPYLKTPEREARADEILRLARKAALLEHPL